MVKDTNYYRSVVVRQMRTFARSKGLSDAQIAELICELSVKAGLKDERGSLKGATLYRMASPSQGVKIQSWVAKSAYLYLTAHTQAPDCDDAKIAFGQLEDKT